MCDFNAPSFLQVLRDTIYKAVKDAIGSFFAKLEGSNKLVWRMDDVADQIGLSESTIRNYLNSDGPWFDPEFPKPIRLGSGAAARSAIGWRRTDIEAWVNSRPAHEALHQVNKKKSSAEPAPGRTTSSRTFRSQA